MTVELEGRRIALTNLGRVLWPAAGFTKGEMIDFYAHVAPALVPHVAGRPLTLGRFPEGVERPGFAQGECRGRPDWMATHPLRLRSGEVRRYCVVNDLPSLVWVANMGTIELHPFLARGDRFDRPTAVVFDLDPGPPADIVECCRVALRLREALASFGLASFPKTSGSVGLHVYAPVASAHAYAETKAFARSVAALLAADDPKGVVDTAKRSRRQGKVLVDWVQNDATRSTVAPYSLRATPWPTVSTPVTWDEVELTAASENPELLTFTSHAVLERLERFGDLFRPVLETEQSLPLGAAR